VPVAARQKENSQGIIYKSSPNSFKFKPLIMADVCCFLPLRKAFIQYSTSYTKKTVMPTFDCVEKPMAMLFYRYGRAVAKRPISFIFVPLLITLISALGFLQLNTVSDPIYLFTPTDAQSKAERQSIHDLWPLRSGNYVPGRAVTQSREVQVGLCLGFWDVDGSTTLSYLDHRVCS
jgi:hypothetical protein